MTREDYKQLNTKIEQASTQFLYKTDQTIADHLEHWANVQPEKPFILYQKERITWGEVNQRAEQYARIGLHHGIAPGDSVALLMENRPEFFYAWFGMLKIGACTALINTEARGGALTHAMATVDSKMAFVGTECFQRYLSGDGLVGRYKTIVVPDGQSRCALVEGCIDISDALQQAAGAVIDPEIRAQVVSSDTACFIFTSGTTGLPKAAFISHAKWLVTGHRVKAQTDFTADDVFYCVLPIFHGAGLMALYSSVMSVGATSVLRRKFSASHFWKDVAAHGVTYFQYVGEICRYLLNTAPVAEEDEHTLRILYGSGLGMDLWSPFVHRFGDHIRIFEGWGSTESNCSTTNFDNHPGSCGRIPDWNETILAFVRYDVENECHPRDDDGFLVRVEAGEPGEVLGQVRTGSGEMVSPFDGYRNREETEKKLLHDVFESGDCWYRTGDMLRYDSDDYVYFVDRVGDTFRWKSENVATTEVAQQLSQYDPAELINVYGVQVPGHEGRAGMASIVMQPGKKFDGREFYRIASASLAAYAQPQFVRIMKQMDMTMTFKQRKVDLQTQGYDPHAFADELFVLNAAVGSYVPYSLASLEAAGLPPFND